MSYREIVEKIYRVVRHQSQWREKDKERVERMAKLLQIEIESEMLKAGFVPIGEANNIEMFSQESKPIQTSETLALLKEMNDKITKLQEQNSLNSNLGSYTEVHNTETVKDEIKNPVKNVIDVFKEKNIMGKKRWFITLHCDNMIKKPSFQLFGSDLHIERDFKTDEILKQKIVYHFVLDIENVSLADNYLSSCFHNYSIISQEEHTLDWIPTQYQTIFRHQTSIIE